MNLPYNRQENKDQPVKLRDICTVTSFLYGGSSMNRLRWQSQIPLHPRNTVPEKKKSHWLKNILLIFTFFVLFFVLTLILIEYRLSPVIYVWAQARAINLGTRAINIAVEETMAASISLTEMTHLISDNQGALQAIQYDTGEINRVSSQATHKIQQSLQNMAQEEFPIPIGQLIGLDFLSAWGPGIPVRMVPVGSVETSPISSFSSAGINQTWHRIYLDVQVKMRVVVPLIAHEFLVATRIPIVEEVIIGSVPSWYFAPGGMVGGFSQVNQTTDKSQPIEFELFNLGL